MAITSTIKNAWLDLVIKTLVERIPVLSKVFSWIDGNKTVIGRCVMFLAALLAFLQSPEGYPDLFVQYPWLDTFNTYYVAFAGWLMTELGLQHKALKAKDSEGVVDTL